MASVIIREKDLTTSSLDTNITDIAYVCGFGDPQSDPNNDLVNVPTLFTSLGSFITAIGSTPRTFSASYNYDSTMWDASEFDSTSSTMFAQNAVDPGYVYAAELLATGMPVYYEKVNASGDPITPQFMYHALFGSGARFTESILNKLRDRGTYRIKYLTTGGYPNFGCKAQSNVQFKAQSLTAGTYTEKVATVDITSLETGESFLSNPTISTTTSDVMVSIARASGSTTGTYKYVVTITYTGSTTAPTTVDVVYSIGNTSTTEMYLNDIMVGVVAAETTDSSATSTQGRGDCVALIDHTNYASRSLKATNTGSVYYKYNNYINNAQNRDSYKFASMYTPWCSYAVSAIALPNGIQLPASFAYLKCMANSIQYYSSFQAVAGVTRGKVTGVGKMLTDEILTNTIANSYQKDTNGVSINAITMVQPYGYVIWGNRTSMYPTEGLTASSYMNLRNMMCDIKKVVYDTAMKYMFEQNSAILWVNFKNDIAPTLDKMKTSQGLYNYTITRGTNTAKTKLYANITLYPIYAVETIDVTIELRDEDLTVAES